MADYCGSAGCGCFRCCFSFVFTSGLTVFFVWLSLRTSNPKCSLLDLYIPPPNQTNFHNITLTLKFQNVMKDKDVRYDDLNLTLLYYSPNTSRLIGNTTMKRFKQGHSKKARKQETLLAPAFNWDAKVNKSGVFGVGLSTKVKFKIMFWYTKKHHWHFAANVTVDDTGKWSSGSLLHPMGYTELLGLFVVLYLIISDSCLIVSALY